MLLCTTGGELERNEREPTDEELLRERGKQLKLERKKKLDKKENEPEKMRQSRNKYSAVS